MLPTFFGSKGINKIKAKKVGDGQYGKADFSTEKEKLSNLSLIEYNPKVWRKDKSKRPKTQGIIVGAKKSNKKVYTYIDSSDNHTMVIAAPGGGKTSSLLYPNLEYSAASGMSGFVTDTKGGVFQDFAPILEKYYGCKTYIIDLRYPIKSNKYNFLSIINKYMDNYKKYKDNADLAASQSYAKNIADNIIHMDGFKEAGTNQYFYTSAEGIISGIIMLVSQYGRYKERHISSVFRLIRECMEIDQSKKPINGEYTIKLKTLYDLLPDDHTAKNLLASAATSEGRTQASVISTAIAQLQKFIDIDMEQLLCFDGEIDIREMAKGKYFVFFVVDEKSNTKNFMVNLIIRQIYTELLKEAEKKKDITLKNRIMFWLDEFGTYTKIDGAEQMFSAGRSRNIICVPIIQTLAQLDKNYGQDGAKTIKNSCQNMLFFISVTRG